MLRDHLRDHGAAGEERRAQVEVDHLVPLLVGHLVEHRVLGAAHHGDHHVDPAKLLDNCRDDALHVLVRPRIGLDERHERRVGDVKAHDKLVPVRAVEICDNRLGALLAEAPGDCLADEAGAAGHDCYAALKPSTHVEPLVLLGQNVDGASASADAGR